MKISRAPKITITAPRPTRPHLDSGYISGGGVERVAQDADQSIDLGLLDDERRCELDGVAAVADVDAVGEALHRDLVRPLRRLAGDGGDGEAGGEAEVADVGDVLGALEAVDGVLEVRREAGDPL